MDWKVLTDNLQTFIDVSNMITTFFWMITIKVKHLNLYVNIHNFKNVLMLIVLTNACKLYKKQKLMNDNYSNIFVN